jgi:tetratricopeptide (TPR) repeat protein
MGHTRLLLRLYGRPGAAMSGILDQGSLLYSSLAVLLVSFFYRSPFYLPLLVLAVFYVPGLLLLGKLFAGLNGSLGSVFSRDYSPLLTCTAMAWAAANLPVVLVMRMLPLRVLLYVAGAAQIYFLILTFFAVRTVFGAENRGATLIVCFSWIPLLAAAFLWGPLRLVLGYLASPFFLFYAYYYLGGEIGNLGAGLRSRQNFHRLLNVAALNPHDADAQYQLGLIYQQRRQLTEAVERFKKAVAIDPRETDAHFQLGRIARQQGRLKEALDYFQTVYDQDDKHSQSEILRELGAVYLAARQFEDARRFLADYTERRPYDPEGQYLLGQALEGLGRAAEARASYEQAVEAVRTAPRYRRRIIASWSRLAQKQLGKLSAA